MDITQECLDVHRQHILWLKAQAEEYTQVTLRAHHTVTSNDEQASSDVEDVLYRSLPRQLTKDVAAAHTVGVERMRKPPLLHRQQGLHRGNR